jgi:hypothetical protein
MTVLRQSCAVFCRNQRICDLQINHKKIADLLIAEWHIEEICGFSVAE